MIMGSSFGGYFKFCTDISHTIELYFIEKHFKSRNLATSHVGISKKNIKRNYLSGNISDHSLWIFCQK